MITDTYRFAEQAVQISSLYEYVHAYCADYRVSETPAFEVMTSEKDIGYEREKSRREDVASGRKIREFSAPYLESLAVYRKIAERMPHYDTILFHGSVVAVDGEGYLFTAKSGTGKSTHTQRWMDYFGERAVIINDDKPLLRIAGGTVTAYGTPYNGKHRRGCPLSVPLRAVCALDRAAENRIERVGKSAVYPLLVQQAYRPSDPVALALTLSLLDRAAECVGLYRLWCNMDIEAAKVAYQGMKGS
jgi:Serine kinase of the HPr protein, regulates carbohydrate metabolism